MTGQRLTEDHVWEQPGMQHVLKRAMGLDQHLVVDYRDGELQAGVVVIDVAARQPITRRENASITNAT